MAGQVGAIRLVSALNDLDSCRTLSFPISPLYLSRPTLIWAFTRSSKFPVNLTVVFVVACTLTLLQTPRILTVKTINAPLLPSWNVQDVSSFLRLEYTATGTQLEPGVL